MNLPDNYEIIKDNKYILQSGDIYAMNGYSDWIPIINSTGQPISNYRGYTFARPIKNNKNQVKNLPKPTPVSYEEYQEITDINQLCGNDTYYKEKSGTEYYLLQHWGNRTVAYMKKNHSNLTFYKKNEKPRFVTDKKFPWGY